MRFDDLWPLEEALWLGGADDYARILHPACRMAFAEVGVLDAAAILESVEGQRWRSVSAREGVLSQVTGDLVVIGYRAQAEKEDSPAYRCVCTSTYLRTGGAWRIIQHQQSAE